MLFELVRLALVAVFLSVCFWVVYNLPVLAAGVLDFRRGGSRRRLLAAASLPTFSVLVPVKNEAKVVGRLLNALSRLNYPVDKREIIIVEDGSTDGTFEVCAGYAASHANVKVLRKSSSEGKPSALNFGLKYARGDIVAVFDADSVPDVDALLAAVGYFEDPRVAAVQGKTLSINRFENLLTRFVSYEEAVWCDGYLRGKDVLGLFVHLKGSCMFIRRCVLEGLGGFDEKALSEDMEFSARLLANGYRLRYAGDVVSWQESPSRLKSLFRQRTRWFRGTMSVALKYGRLMGRLGRVNFDAEMTLFGPFVLIASIMPYFFAFFPLPSIGVIAALWSVVLQFGVFATALSLFVVGLALIFASKPRGFRNVLWLPFVYFYWCFQAFVALYALLLNILRRPARWIKTEKTGTFDFSLRQGEAAFAVDAAVFSEV